MMNKKLTATRDRSKPVRVSTSLEMFTITTKALTPDERKDSRQNLSDEDNNLLEYLMKSLRTQPEKITSEECEYFQELEKLRLKYTQSPIILNYLGIGYQHLKQTEKVKSLIFETYEKFPDYLFARTAKAQLLFEEGKLAEGFEAIGNSLTIKQLYPHRDVFHVSEVKIFEDILVKYCYFMHDLEQAEYHLKIIEKIAIEILENPQDPVFVSARNLLQFGKEFLGFRKKKKTKRK